MTKSDLIVTNIAISINTTVHWVNKPALFVNKGAFLFNERVIPVK